MIEYLTNFSYLSPRRYIHGTTLLIDMLSVLEQHVQHPIYLKRIKFLKESHYNGTIYIANDNTLNEKINQSSCYLICTEFTRKWIGIFIENNKPVSQDITVEYSIDKLISDGKLGGHCQIYANNRTDLIRTLVEANKRLHLTHLGNSYLNSKVRMGYIEDWAIPQFNECIDSQLTVKNLIYQQTSNGIKTINKLSYNSITSLIISFDIILTSVNE